MSRERKFHEWIEQQNREEKNRVWEKIQQKEAERLAAQGEAKPAPKKPFPWRRWTAIAAGSLAAVFLGVFAIVHFLPENVTTSNSSESTAGDRYFTNQSYEVLETDKTLKV